MAESGEPRPVKDYEYALRMIDERMVKIADIKDPELFMEFPVIREALKIIISVLKKKSDS